MEKYLKTLIPEKIKQLKIKLLNKNSKVTIVKETDKALLEENKLL